MTSSLVDGSTVTGSPAGRRSLRVAQAPRRRLTGAHRALRVLLGVVLVAVSGLLVVGQEQFRHAEAAAMSMLLKPFLGDDVFAFADQFVIRQDATHYLGLQITVECTTLVLLVPVLLFLAVMITFVQRLTWGRWALGGLVGLALISAINLVRIGMIAGSTLAWDDIGYEWSHLLVGSVFALIGCAATLVLMLRIMTGRRTTTTRKTRNPKAPAS